MTGFESPLATSFLVGLVAAATIAIYIALKNADDKKKGKVVDQDYWPVLFGGLFGLGVTFVGIELFGRAKAGTRKVQEKTEAVFTALKGKKGPVQLNE